MIALETTRSSIKMLTIRDRARRVGKNLKQGIALAWAASPRSLIRYSLLGMVSAMMPPLAIFLGAILVNRIAEARAQSLGIMDLLPIVIGLWGAAGAQRAVGAYKRIGSLHHKPGARFSTTISGS